MINPDDLTEILKAVEDYNSFMSAPKIQQYIQAKERTERDIISRIDYAKEQGIAVGEFKGEAKGMLEAYRNMQKLGLTDDVILQYLGISKDKLQEFIDKTSNKN